MPENLVRRAPGGWKLKGKLHTGTELCNIRSRITLEPHGRLALNSVHGVFTDYGTVRSQLRGRSRFESSAGSSNTFLLKKLLRLIVAEPGGQPASNLARTSSQLSFTL
jgi:hypothetical protein